MCSGTRSGHFSATSTSCAVHMWHEVTELPFKPVEEKGALPCARLCGRKVASSASGEEVPYPLHQKALGRGPIVTDSQSQSGRWEIMVWSKTTSSGNRVSAGIAVHVLGHTEPQGHRRDPAFHWITGLRPHWPLCRYPVTNLPVLTSTQSNDAARPASRPGFALRHRDQSKSGPAGCSWEKKMGGKREGGLDGGRAGRAI